MKSYVVVLFSFLAAAPALAQLTTDQRLADFRNLVDLYARRYAAVEWKKAAVNFDLMNVSPWLERVRAATSDLEFYDLMVEYVASLKDAHDQYLLPSDFNATLGFTVDLYDGKPLIETISRNSLPMDTYPFGIGDELVSVDGRSAADWIQLLAKYVSAGSSRASDRIAAELITDRYQAYYPWAAEIGDEATVVIRRQSGAEEMYTIPWRKSGTPLTVLGPSAAPMHRPMQARAARPRYQEFLDKFRTFQLPGKTNLAGFGRLAPVFVFPDSFVLRLGRRAWDSYYTGTYLAEDGTRIGYLRIADFMYNSTLDLDDEVTYFEENTDVLVVDVMRNPGGSACSAERILSRLSPRGFQGVVAETRVTWWDIVDVNSALADAIDYEDDEAVAQLTAMQKEYVEAYEKNQGRTRPLPICGATADRTAAANAYTKPVLVLADEISASSADIFAAMAQDSQLGPIFGYRTMGAGGSPEEDNVGVYSEGYTTLTRSLVVRPKPVVTPDFPTTSYVENVGVRPDIEADYMTADNLLNQGKAFVSAFTAAAVQLVKRQIDQ